MKIMDDLKEFEGLERMGKIIEIETNIHKVPKDLLAPMLGALIEILDKETIDKMVVMAACRLDDEKQKILADAIKGMGFIFSLPLSEKVSVIHPGRFIKKDE